MAYVPETPPEGEYITPAMRLYLDTEFRKVSIEINEMYSVIRDLQSQIDTHHP